MSSRRRRIERDVRAFDISLRKKRFEIYSNVLERFVSAYPSGVGDEVMRLLKARDFISLIRWADSYGGAAKHSTAAETYAASQLSALIKKYPFPAPELKKISFSTAVEKFLLAEKQCKRYNLKLRRLFTKGSRFRQQSILNQMAAHIRYVLGESPNLPAIYDECSFGPGASIGVHGSSTNSARKFLSDKWTCSPSALPYAESSMLRDNHLYELLLPHVGGFVCMDPESLRKEIRRKTELVHYNKIVTVPKTALVDRTIAVEPLLNGYLQKGADVVMRRRLKRVGIDLSDQTRNQNLSRLGSTESSDPFVTIDLSMASDSISSALARRLLPPDWYHFLDAIRSPAYVLPNAPTSVRYEKFVSMGNGFCFPLETLIFASVCMMWSKSATDYSVYGDDIIVRQSISQKVIKTLWEIGFRHNPRKTFTSGPFRESCGADWFAGLDVRPLGLDFEFDSLNSLIKFHNLSMLKPFWELAFSEVREYLRELVPHRLRMCRPYKGDIYGAFEVPFDTFLGSAFSKFDRDIQAWSWLELGLSGVPDKGLTYHERYPTVLMMAALRGALPRMPFARRRETTQSVRRKAYAGATSSWLPPQ